MSSKLDKIEDHRHRVVEVVQELYAMPRGRGQVSYCWLLVVYDDHGILVLHDVP